jgi:RNA polymerase sigma factor (sigma-70 family)
MSKRPTWPPAQVEVHGTITAMGLDPDLNLLEAWRAGDKEAAGRLLKHHHRAITRAVAMAVPEDDVEDTVSKVIVALLEGREKFRGDATFRTYAMKVTKYIIASYYRARRPTVSLDASKDSAHDLGAGPLTLLGARQEQRMLLEALRNIALDDQFILVLHYWEKMTAPQLAQVFECSEPAIRHRLRRAKRHLRETLQSLAEEHRELADTLTDLDAWARGLREVLEAKLGKT